MTSLLSIVNLILEVSAVNAATKNWLTTSDESEVNQAISDFVILKQRNIIKHPDSDISIWVKRPFADFKKFVDSHMNKYSKKLDEKKPGKEIRKVFENDKVIVIVPLTWESSQRYGKGTKWCISGKKYEHWFTHRVAWTIYFMLSKKRKRNDELYKVAVAVSIDNKIAEIYNAKNETISMEVLDNLLNEYNIDKNIFKYVVNPHELQGTYGVKI